MSGPAQELESAVGFGGKSIHLAVDWYQPPETAPSLGACTDHTPVGHGQHNGVPAAELGQHPVVWFAVVASQMRAVWSLLAASESLWAVIECEIGARRWPTRAAARTALFEYIEEFYSRQRLRKYPEWGYLTPLGARHRFHQQHALAA